MTKHWEDSFCTCLPRKTQPFPVTSDWMLLKIEWKLIDVNLICKTSMFLWNTVAISMSHCQALFPVTNVTLTYETECTTTCNLVNMYCQRRTNFPLCQVISLFPWIYLPWDRNVPYPCDITFFETTKGLYETLSFSGVITQKPSPSSRVSTFPICHVLCPASLCPVSLGISFPCALDTDKLLSPLAAFAGTSLVCSQQQVGLVFYHSPQQLV